MFLRHSLIAGAALALLAMASPPASAHGPAHPMSGGAVGDPSKVSRVVDVVATDNAFSLKSLDVKEGETIRFQVRNEGFTEHEFVIGTKAEHAEHLKMMRAMIEQQKKMGGHAGHAMAPMEHTSGVSVSPGATASFVWTFVRTGNLEFACDMPGHYEDGMRGLINFVR